jgi:hypothetical protein
VTEELRIVVCSCMHGNEPLGSIKGGEFFDQPSDYQLIKDSLCHSVK